MRNDTKFDHCIFKNYFVCVHVRGHVRYISMLDGHGHRPGPNHTDYERRHNTDMDMDVDTGRDME